MLSLSCLTIYHVMMIRCAVLRDSTMTLATAMAVAVEHNTLMYSITHFILLLLILSLYTMSQGPYIIRSSSASLRMAAWAWRFALHVLLMGLSIYY